MNLRYDGHGTILRVFEEDKPARHVAIIYAYGSKDGISTMSPEDHKMGALLAAAPEAIAFCQEMVDWFDEMQAKSDPQDPLYKAREYHHGKRIARARAAIAKATPRGITT